jgi:putative flavoprotein involved in K+ transport
VVIATGPFHRPVIPSVAGGFDPAVTQLHTAEYRNPAGLPPGPVLVVGAGNSGCQVARELSASRAVHLSTGDRNPVLPQRILGRDFFWWAGLVRFDRITAQSRLGRRLQTRDPVFGDGPRRLARRCRVRLHPRLVGAEGRTARFTDGTTATVNSVVWATGFTVDHSLVTVPGVLDENGRIRQQGGVTSSRGLYTIGLPWQRTRGSALLGFVGRDAADITDRIARDAAAARAAA